MVSTGWLARHSLDHHQSESEWGRSLREVLHTAWVVEIVCQPGAVVEPRSFYDAVTRSLGEEFKSGEDPHTGARTGEKWIGISYDPAYPQRYRSSATPQPLHTDGSYLTDAADLAFMYCERQATVGGATIFVDSAAIARYLESTHPSLYLELLKTSVTFLKASDRRTEPILTRDERGFRFNWNYHCVDPNSPPGVLRLVEQFHACLQAEVVPSPLVREVRLQAGGAVVWHDQRVLHGRRGFAALQRGDRCLWKTAVYLR